MTTLTVGHMTTTEAAQVIKRFANSAVLMTYGVEVFTESAHPVTFGTGEQLEGCWLKVRAGSDRQAGIGMGFLLAKI